jgi:hypothetical protein
MISERIEVFIKLNVEKERSFRVPRTALLRVVLEKLRRVNA